MYLVTPRIISKTVELLVLRVINLLWPYKFNYNDQPPQPQHGPRRISSSCCCQSITPDDGSIFGSLRPGLPRCARQTILQPQRKLAQEIQSRGLQSYTFLDVSSAAGF